MSKRKKHNPNKRAQRFFSNARLWSWESMVDELTGMRISHGEAKAGFVWRQLSQSQADNLTHRNNNWVIVCRALCVAGDKVWTEESIRSARDIKVNDFADIYEEMRAEVMAAVQERHVVDCGWIAQSFGKNDRIDNKQLPLIHLGEASEERRMAWHLARQIEAKEAA